MATKETFINVDLATLRRHILQQQEKAAIEKEEALDPDSTVFSAENSRAVSNPSNPSPPNIISVQLKKDALLNFFTRIRWNLINDNFIEFSDLLGFEIYRRRISSEGVFEFSSLDFEKLSRGVKNFGKFSPARKAITFVKRGAIDGRVLNNNLNDDIQKDREKFNRTLEETDKRFSKSGFERFLKGRKFEKIQFIDLSKRAGKIQKKGNVITSREESFTFSFDDKNVNIGDRYEYYIVTLLKDGQKSSRSRLVNILVEDTSTVPPPKRLLGKPITEHEIQLSALLQPSGSSLVKRVLFFRKAEDDVQFEEFWSTENKSDSVNIIDGEVEYGKNYIYRVFNQNIYGTLSEPKEITVFANTQKVTSRSRSNDLKLPVFVAVQDQNSDFVKVVISPNDPRILYYELKRKDNTIKEKKFLTPSAIETNFGGNGWRTNKFFVDKQRDSVDSKTLNTDFSAPEIVFLDDTSRVGHSYTYRVQGYDTFGNSTPYSFSTVNVKGKNSIRAPINLRHEVLQTVPFKVKISWDDDNTELESLERDKIIYKVQRRKNNENIYKTFPLTENNFIIDEVEPPKNIDSVPFMKTREEFQQLIESRPELLEKGNLTRQHDFR